MPLTITNAQRAQVNQRRQLEFQARVIDHVREKLVFSSATSRGDFEVVANLLYGKVHAFLEPYERASYESYVRLMIVYFIRGIDQVEGPDVQTSLRNERFDINTRVFVSYELAKLFLEEGL